MIVWRLLRVMLACFLAVAAHADEFRPAYLELRQVAPETYDVTWRVPARGELQRLALSLQLPEDAVRLSEPKVAIIGSNYVEHWRIRQPGGIEGHEIAVSGLAGTSAEVLVRIETSSGGAQVMHLIPSRPMLTVAVSAGVLQVATAYTLLGIEHILLGIDHLLFVFALLLLVRGSKRIALTITAFTLAHSITLALATLGWLVLPSPPVEAVIALSIAFLAREIVISQRGQGSLTESKPWLVAFIFGLLHGLGFAGALAEIGLPKDSIVLALLCFNVGVEIGQLMFVTVVLAGAFVLRRWLLPWQQHLKWVSPFFIGGVASYWLIARVLAFGQ